MPTFTPVHESDRSLAHAAAGEVQRRHLLEFEPPVHARVHSFTAKQNHTFRAVHPALTGGCKIGYLMTTPLGMPWASISSAMVTVSPNRWYRGIFHPTTYKPDTTQAMSAATPEIVRLAEGRRTPAMTGPQWMPMRTRIGLLSCATHTTVLR